MLSIWIPNRENHMVIKKFFALINIFIIIWQFCNSIVIGQIIEFLHHIMKKFHRSIITKTTP